MKHLIKTVWILLAFPLQILAQPAPKTDKDLAGIWNGYISTAQKKLPYELVISEQDGKLIVYSYTTFTVDGAEFVSLKKMKTRFKNKEIILEDMDLLFNNFNTEAPKKIKQINTLFLNVEGEQLKLTGRFATKTNGVLRPANGEVYLNKAEKYDDTKIMAKLGEMKLTAGLGFIPIQVSADIAGSTAEVMTAPPVPLTPVTFSEQQKIPAENQKQALAKIEKPAQPRINIPPVTPVEEAVAAIAEVVPAAPIPLAPADFKEQAKIITINQKQAIAKINRPAQTSVYIPPVPAITRSTPVVPTAPVITIADPLQTTSTEPVVTFTVPASRRANLVNIAVAPALDLGKRKIENISQLFIESDSLTLTLYDNGEVDGDSVSLVLNGKTIVSKQGLSTLAFTKTIYITPDLGDSIQLVMYAENLGTLPPNTGLLILQFDKERHEIRFSGDMNKNAAITLRKRQKK